MDFVDMVQKLQIIYGDELVLVSSGAFYMTFGLPAVILTRLGTVLLR